MSSRNFGSKQFRGNREIGTVTHRLVVVAGVPPEVAGQFGTAFSKMASRELVKLTVLSSYRLDLSYTEDFVSRVYDKLVYKLREYASTPRESLLADTNVIVLFLQRSDGSDHILFEKFGVETLVTPMLVPNIADMPTDTRGQRGNVVNKLIREACLAIRHAKLMLCTIHEDLNGRENKTCLLLPPKTFGRGFLQVQRRVWDATTSREEPMKFAKSLKTLGVAKSGKYYVGQWGLVYKSPSKAGPRHGFGPVWQDGHEPSCVIRGRLRFGATYDPRFHYDCQIPGGWDRRFPGCHEPLRLPSNQRHANCAPNDGVR